MYSTQTIVVNRSGLHARPASDFVREARKFYSNITITNLDLPDEGPASAKNIVQVLSLGIGRGCSVELAADGEDEFAAVESLKSLIESGFSEGIAHEA